MLNTRLKVLGVLGSLLLAFGAGAYFGLSHSLHSWAQAQTLGGVQPTDVDMSQFWQAYQLLNQNFVVTHASSTFPAKQEQVYGAIAGLTASFGDPYTTFFPPAEAKIFQDDIKGSFGGVGMQIDNDAKGNIVVVAPLKDSPSQKAGIHSGDIVLKIGATSTAGMVADQAVKIIRGPIGTTVTITVARQGETKPLVFDIVRDTINIPIIETKKLDNGIFKISLYSFSENSTDLSVGRCASLYSRATISSCLICAATPAGILTRRLRWQVTSCL